MPSVIASDRCRNIHDPITKLDHDILGRKVLAQVIQERLRKSDLGALGIYGGWGTGKTSLLNLLCELNKQQSIQSGHEFLHIEVIDAWKYEAGEGLLIPVIVRLKKMLKKTDLPESWRVITRRVLATATLSVSDVLLRRIAQIDIKEIAQTYEEIVKKDKQRDDSSILQEWEEWSDEIENTEQAFGKIIDFVLKENDYKRLVICIDNLDRCSPENAVRLLESVKNFFSASECIWVFAMDAEVIASYIDHKYEGTSVDGNSYLDKIIPEQYHLSFSPEENDRRVFDLIYEATGGFVTLNDKKRLPQIPRVMVPRRLKKSAGKFAEFFDGGAQNAERDTVFLLSLLYHTWPEFYERLSSPSIKHIGDVLANFFKNLKTEGMGLQWGEYSPSPLDKKFTEDQDLIYFLRTAFPMQNNSAELVQEIYRAMGGLRQIGLP